MRYARLIVPGSRAPLFGSNHDGRIEAGGTQGGQQTSEKGHGEGEDDRPGETRPLWSLLLGAFPQYVTTTERVGRAMLRSPNRALPGPSLNRVTSTPCEPTPRATLTLGQP